ncbi:cytochrome P450 [Rhodococcus sp. NPDC127530]|uniref:cytochrome P450 n=1 Tax=unclassified Rhodococcus (in: high G+C Gram-positive bacteria) TaxID=192944 RepID=UPI003636C774
MFECARMESTAQWFTRVTSCEVQIGEITIPAGSRMLHSYASANRDERHYPNAHVFDVRRNPTDHLAFGYGPHSCVGKNLSGLEVNSLFKELAKRVDRIELNGEPHLHPNNIIRGLESVPLKISCVCRKRRHPNERTRTASTNSPAAVASAGIPQK